MKKTYIEPAIKKRDIEFEGAMQAFTGGGTQPGDPIIDPNPDPDDDDNRSKSFNAWDDELGEW